jgi:predicted N-acetyltransferase YhbS
MRTPHPFTCTSERSAAILGEPWTMRSGEARLIVRPSNAHDLAATAIMHRRCSARSLLARYRLGGQAPPVLALDRQLRASLSFVVTMAPDGSAPGAVIATGLVDTDSEHGPGSARVAVLVEDSWQRQGIGRELMRHLAGAAALAGYSELIASSASGTAVAQRLLVGIGPTRYVADVNGGHLHTTLPASAVGGLGPLRAGRFVWGDHGVDYAEYGPQPA